MAIAVVTTTAGLLALIYIGSPTVYSDVISLSVSGLYASYFIPCTFLLWRRTTGKIRDRRADDDDYSNSLSIHPIAASRPEIPNGDVHPVVDGANSHNNNITADEVIQPALVWGPWRVPGLVGTINNAFACVYIVFVILVLLAAGDAGDAAEHEL